MGEGYTTLISTILNEKATPKRNEPCQVWLNLVVIFAKSFFPLKQLPNLGIFPFSPRCVTRLYRDKVDS